MKVKSESEVAQSCLTPSNPMDYSLQGFSVHGIFQARVLEWDAIAFSSSDFWGPPKIKPLTVSIVSPSICHEVMAPDAMIFFFWLLSFKPDSSLSSFTFIKRFFSSSLLSALRVVSSAYLRLLIFSPAILTPVCASFSPAIHMMYSASKVNKQGDNIQPWCTPFPLWNQSVVHVHL